MGATFVHRNPTIFPRPREFIPERWLGEGKGYLDQYLVSFSKGPRTCLGIKYVSLVCAFYHAGAHHAYFLWYSLAWCELYLFFGYLFRKVEMELHYTTYVHLEVGADKDFEFP